MLPMRVNPDGTAASRSAAGEGATGRVEGTAEKEDEAFGDGRFRALMMLDCNDERPVTVAEEGEMDVRTQIRGCVMVAFGCGYWRCISI